MTRDEKVLALVDWENGCDECWEAARAAGVVDARGPDYVLSPPEWVEKKCEHDPPEYAQTILRKHETTEGVCSRCGIDVERGGERVTVSGWYSGHRYLWVESETRPLRLLLLDVVCEECS